MQTETNHWLNECLGDYDPQQGVFKLTSTLSWAAALRFEIERVHGATPESQLASCRTHFQQQKIKKAPQDSIGEVYCALYHALTSATTLVSMDQGPTGQYWMYPSAVVTWYYTHYNVVRAALIARNQPPTDNHSAVQKAMNTGLRRQLPHPFNMVATFDEAGKPTALLPDARDAVCGKLNIEFNDSADTALGMLLEYLDRTAMRERERVEEDLRDKKTFTNFRSKAAKDHRNGLLRKTPINFLHCAFRYRGKANYRDSLYLTYGTRVRPDYEQFLHNLVVSARFAYLFGFTFAEKAFGTEVSRRFLNDLKRNFRGIGTADERVLFWRACENAI